MRNYNLIVVTGANSGLGEALARELIGHTHNFVFWVLGPDGDPPHGLRDGQWASIDFMGGDVFLSDTGIGHVAAKIQAWKDNVLETISAGDEASYNCILVNCAGVNYIDWFTQADFAEFDRLMQVNVKGALSLIQCLLGETYAPIDENEVDNFFDCDSGGTICNIISNASHMPMTNSVFYNASKGAMHIATLALGRELKKTHGINVFGVSPNKLKGTGMSGYIEGRVPALRGWTPEEAESYQLAALPAGEETDPLILAEFLTYILNEPIRHKYLANTVIPYGA
jgi:NAD(P)-dependent dehydrogenase (short-subunit alcohol dehydrogenase family)